MTRPNIATVTLAILAFVFLAAAVACELEYRSYPAQLAGLTPLSVPMSASEPVRASFAAVWSEPHYVALVFPRDVDSETAALLRQASDAVGAVKESAVHFDFNWQVHEGALEVGRDEGRARPTGSFGSLEQGLEFGEFPAVAGHVYQIEIRPGPDFGAWARAQPVIEVGVNTASPSVGLPWVKDLARLLELIFASFGLIFMGGAIWTMRR